MSKRKRVEDNTETEVSARVANDSNMVSVAGSSSKTLDIDSFEALKSLIVRKESLETIKAVIEKNPTKQLWKLTDEQGYNMLHIATQFEYLEVMTYAMELGIHVNSKTSQGSTPLQIALYSHKKKDFLDIMKLLIEKGADMFTNFDDKNNTFVHLLPYYLTTEQYHESVKLLISLGHAGIFHQLNNLNLTPLHLAVEELDVSTETLELIANSCGYDFNKPFRESGDDCSLIMYAARWGGSRKTLENLIKVGADWKLTNSIQETVLHMAVEGNNFPAIDLFMSLGADVNARDSLGRTPIHHIESHETESKKHYIKLTQVLLDYGADIYATDNNGETVANDLFSEASREDYENWARFVVGIGHGKLFGVSSETKTTPNEQNS